MLMLLTQIVPARPSGQKMFMQVEEFVERFEKPQKVSNFA